MPYFFGTYGPVPVDPKGRIILPRKIRGSLPPEAGENCVLAVWMDECLAVFDPQTWRDMISRIQAKASVSDPGNRQFIRLLSANAEEGKLDTQGRLTISKNLQDKAHITDRALVIVNVDHAEIWDPDRYREQTSVLNLSDIAAQTDLI